jgi:hypothetical protein
LPFGGGDRPIFNRFLLWRRSLLLRGFIIAIDEE